MPAHDVLKRRLQTVLGRPSAHAVLTGVRRSDRRLGIALVYHRVGDPPGDPATELVPRLATRGFAVQMAWVVRHFEPVTASELPDRVGARGPGDPIPLAVTFDDDVREHRQAALDGLARYGVPATFFLCGHALETPRSFWWERLERARRAGGLAEALASTPVATEARAVTSSPASVHALGKAIIELTPDARDDVAARLAVPAGPDPQDAGLRSIDITALARAGHEIGFHTRRHDNLLGLDDEALVAALQAGAAEVGLAAGRRPTAIAYPHGRADGRVAAAAAACGWATGWTTAGRAVTPTHDRLLLPRVEPVVGAETLSAQVAVALARAYREAAR